MPTLEDGRRALKKIARDESADREQDARVIVNDGTRFVTVRTEGGALLDVHRGAYDPGVNALVKIIRPPTSDRWRIAGVADRTIASKDNNRYDTERPGDTMYYPVALEAINNAAYNLQSGLQMTIYNIQFVASDGTLHRINSAPLDVASNVPATDSAWRIVYADESDDSIGIYDAASAASPSIADAFTAANDTISEDTNRVPLLAVLLDSGMTEWGAAWQQIGRGYDVSGRKILRLPYYGKPGGGGALSLAGLSDINDNLSPTANDYLRYDAGNAEFTTLTNNFAASAAPTSTDDSSSGYSVGSLWLDVTHDDAYQCLDATVGSAVWLKIGLDATGVTAGSYTNADITVDEEGRVTAARNGSSGTNTDITVTAGEALAERDYVYLDEASNTWFKVDIGSVPVACGRTRGVVVEAGGIASGNTGSVRLSGLVSGFAFSSPGQPVYAGSSAGLYVQTRPSPTAGGVQVAIVKIGVALSSTELLVEEGDVVQYMKRANLADDGTLTIEHHADAQGYRREVEAYVGSSAVGATLEHYASSNQDATFDLNKSGAPLTYTADQCTGGTAIGDMDNDGSVGLGFDDNASTAASKATADGYPALVGYDFGSGNEKQIRQYTIQEATNKALNSAPTAWEFEYSDDGSNWTSVDSQSGVTNWVDGEIKTYQIADYGAHRYWRVNITDNNGNTAFVNVGEVEMMEGATFEAGYDELAQTFTLASQQDIGGVMLYLQKVGSVGGTLTIRIETTSGGSPTGTLADANLTVTYAERDLNTSLSEETLTFASSATLSAGTYALVLSTDRADDPDNYIAWGADTSAPSYSGGDAQGDDGSGYASLSADFVFAVIAPGTTFVEPATIGRWLGGTRDMAARYDDGSGSDSNTKTTIKNVIGVTSDVTAVVEVP